jgi:serine/threonine-protein kinase RsbW
MPKATFPGRYDSLSKISKFVLKFAKKAGFNNSQLYEIELAVDEACSNIIDHAYGGESKGDIKCTVKFHNENLTIELRDRGVPFNPENVPSPKIGAPLEDVQMRGVGFYLMNKLMDDIHYQSNAKKGNVMTLIKNRG